MSLCKEDSAWMQPERGGGGGEYTEATAPTAEAGKGGGGRLKKTVNVYKIYQSCTEELRDI